MEKSTKSETKKIKEPMDFNKTNLLALSSYLGFFCIAPILIKEKDEFVKFHAKQGIGLFIVEIVTCMIFGIIPLFWLFGGLLMIFWLSLNLIGITNVLNGQKKKLPIIGKFADRFNI